MIHTVARRLAQFAIGASVTLPTLFAQAPAPELPNALGRNTVQRVCGACHSATIVLGRGMTREQWSQVVAAMISRGAKGTPAEFNEVVDYLTTNLPPSTTRGPGAPARARAGGGGFSMGPQDRQIVDAAAADRGKALFAANCANCHGTLARGAAHGPDLVRSEVVLHDRYGNILGPFLRAQHTMPNSGHLPVFTAAQITDLSHFLHQQVDNTLRSGPYTKVLNVLTGDPRAGAAYFDGPGTCTKCHSASGDLAGIASKYEPPTLQQRMLFPRVAALGRRTTISATKPVTVKIIDPDGHSASGTLVRMDDFTVSFRDADGNYHSIMRTPELKLEKNDPYAVHDNLLDQYTDSDIHNLVAYLETLK